MSLTLERDSLAALSLGFSLFGSGGGGSPHLLRLLLEQSDDWPIEISSVNELEPSTPCFAPAVAGSTLLFSERLPGQDAFAPLLESAERWLGTRIPAVCSAEGGGMNGLAPLLFAPGRTVVDADCTGRAVPSLDQFSLLVDEVPGLIVVCDTGANGIVLVQSDRPADIEKMVRSALVQAGGVGNVLVAGFTIDDLRRHAIAGHLERALELGETWMESSCRADSSAGVIGGLRRIGAGRVTSIVQDLDDEHVHTAQIVGERGEVCRLIARSEFLAFVVDGRVHAAAPECLVAVDPLTSEILEATALSVNQRIEVWSLPVDDWWYRREHRLRRVTPAEYRLAGLDIARPDSTRAGGNDVR
ncbi:DUF917 family protein [uncultured Agrococcus sp.]|uniref:S-methyl thiohydantoin desulfurase domain-containing protein n=1 Tax=uncultured Agrococcus sp. TaxID=382258 RepID=UPI0025DCC7B6|nr:DUF917 family protein [uncultured Agrococcus sp.]